MSFTCAGLGLWRRSGDLDQLLAEVLALEQPGLGQQKRRGTCGRDPGAFGVTRGQPLGDRLQALDRREQLRRLDNRDALITFYSALNRGPTGRCEKSSTCAVFSRAWFPVAESEIEPENASNCFVHLGFRLHSDCSSSRGREGRALLDFRGSGFGYGYRHWSNLAPLPGRNDCKK